MPQKISPFFLRKRAWLLPPVIRIRPDAQIQRTAADELIPGITCDVEEGLIDVQIHPIRQGRHGNGIRGRLEGRAIAPFAVGLGHLELDDVGDVAEVPHPPRALPAHLAQCRGVAPQGTAVQQENIADVVPPRLRIETADPGREAIRIGHPQQDLRHQRGLRGT